MSLLDHLQTRRGVVPPTPLAARLDDTDLPWGCDWIWRPSPWREPMPVRVWQVGRAETALAAGVTLFHDCARPEILLTQTDAIEAPGCGLTLDVAGFDGTFLSLVLDLPPEGLTGLRRSHLLRVAARIRAQRPAQIYLRFNLMHSGHREQLVRHVDVTDGRYLVDFEPGLTLMDEARLEKAWIDMIFPDAGGNRIDLRDVAFLRHPRADI